MAKTWWGATEMYWTFQGHVLYVEHNLEERQAAYFEDALQRWFHDESPHAARVDVMPAEQTQTDEATIGHPGTLKVTSETLLSMDAVVLRDMIRGLADEAEHRLGQVLEQEQEQEQESALRPQPRPRRRSAPALADPRPLRPLRRPRAAAPGPHPRRLGRGAAGVLDLDRSARREQRSDRGHQRAD